MKERARRGSNKDAVTERGAGSYQGAIISSLRRAGGLFVETVCGFYCPVPLQPRRNLPRSLFPDSRRNARWLVTKSTKSEHFKHQKAFSQDAALLFVVRDTSGGSQITPPVKSDVSQNSSVNEVYGDKHNYAVNFFCQRK